MKIKLLFPVLLLAACASPQPPIILGTPVAPAAYEPPVIVVSQHNVVDELLAYHQDILRLPRTDLPRELDKLLEKPKDARITLKKAMVLGQMGRKNDLARAQTNLAEVLQHPSVEAQELRPMAQFLSTHYATAQRLAEQLEHNERSLADTQQRLQQLNQTLEQLKAVERSLPARMGTTTPHSEVQPDKK